MWGKTEWTIVVGLLVAIIVGFMFSKGGIGDGGTQGS